MYSGFCIRCHMLDFGFIVDKTTVLLTINKITILLTILPLQHPFPFCGNSRVSLIGKVIL